MRSCAALKTTGRHGGRKAGIIMRATLQSFRRIPYSGQWPPFSPHKSDVDSRSIAPNEAPRRAVIHRLSTGRAVYSITSSARARIDGGMVRPSAFAVFMLMTRSNLVG